MRSIRDLRILIGLIMVLVGLLGGGFIWVEIFHGLQAFVAAVSSVILIFLGLQLYSNVRGDSAEVEVVLEPPKVFRSFLLIYRSPRASARKKKLSRQEACAAFRSKHPESASLSDSELTSQVIFEVDATRWERDFGQ